jgi:nicotinamidase-related amidase
MQTFTKVGLDAILTPEKLRRSPDRSPAISTGKTKQSRATTVINNVTALAKTAKAYGVPTILTTISTQRGGEIFKQIQAGFPDQKPIDRTFINSWEDRRVVDAVKNKGRKKLVIAAPWSEMCLALPAIHAMGEGYDVYVVTDASGGVSPEANDMSIREGASTC